MILHREQRVGAARGPGEDGGVHDVVDVDDVGGEGGDDVVELGRRVRPRLQARPDVERARRPHRPVVLADRQPDLVVRGEALEDPEQEGVGPSSVGQPVGHVQDPHEAPSIARNWPTLP